MSLVCFLTQVLSTLRLPDPGAFMCTDPQSTSQPWFNERISILQGLKEQTAENPWDLGYSFRKACIGSVAAARRAGTQDASKTTAKRRSDTRQSMAGSYQSVR